MLGRLQNTVKPSQDGKREYDFPVIGLPVISSQQIRNAPDETGKFFNLSIVRHYKTSPKFRKSALRRGRQARLWSRSSATAWRTRQYPRSAGCRTHRTSLPRSTPSSSAKKDAGYPVPNAQSSRHVFEIFNESSRHSCPISIPANRR